MAADPHEHSSRCPGPCSETPSNAKKAARLVQARPGPRARPALSLPLHIWEKGFLPTRLVMGSSGEPGMSLLRRSETYV